MKIHLHVHILRFVLPCVWERLSPVIRVLYNAEIFIISMFKLYGILMLNTHSTTPPLVKFLVNSV
jgi:hypothetical protein